MTAGVIRFSISYIVPLRNPGEESDGPEDVELFLDAGEIFVAGGQGA